MTTRVYPPNGKATTTSAHGRTYVCAANSFLDVPDQDAMVLQTNGWIVAALRGVGATSARPTSGLARGDSYQDTTLGYKTVWSGSNWMNPASGASV